MDRPDLQMPGGRGAPAAIRPTRLITTANAVKQLRSPRSAAFDMSRAVRPYSQLGRQ